MWVCIAPVVGPFTKGCLSGRFRNSHSVSGGVRLLIDAFDAYHRASADHPFLFNYGTHPYLSGRPDNAMILRGLLEHVHRHDDVWVTNYGEVARWWRAQYEAKISPDGPIDVTNLG
jgi:hypothetical protein